MPHKKIRKKIINTTASILSAPKTFGARQSKRRADSAVKSIRFLRETKNVPTNARTRLGRERLQAMFNKRSAQNRLRRKGRI